MDSSKDYISPRIPSGYSLGISLRMFVKIPAEVKEGYFNDLLPKFLLWVFQGFPKHSLRTSFCAGSSPKYLSNISSRSSSSSSCWDSSGNSYFNFWMKIWKYSSRAAKCPSQRFFFNREWKTAAVVLRSALWQTIRLKRWLVKVSTLYATTAENTRIQKNECCRLGTTMTKRTK